MHNSTISITNQFFMTFGEQLPDMRFTGMWCSNTDKQIKVAMDKAKVWKSTRPEKTALDCAKIVSAILRDERKREKLYYDDHFSADALRVRSRHSN